MAADTDANGLLDREEFSVLLRKLCPKTKSAAEIIDKRRRLAFSRLQQVRMHAHARTYVHVFLSC